VALVVVTLLSEPQPVAGESDQVTPAFLESFLTPAVSAVEPPAAIEVEAGVVMETAIGALPPPPQAVIDARRTGAKRETAKKYLRMGLLLHSQLPVVTSVHPRARPNQTARGCSAYQSF
jgi:hypothetical protein